MGSNKQVEEDDGMKQLLEELKILDPNCYDEIACGLEQVDIEYEEDIIQGCVQRTISARDWFCSMTVAGSPIFEVIINGKKYVKRTDSSANAILTAYIAARKAQSCRS